MSSRVDSLCVVTAGILWGTGGFAGAMLGLTSGLHPLAVAAYRLALGGAAVLGALAALGRLGPVRSAGRAGLVRVLVTGVLTAAYQACYFVAVSVTSVSVATMVTLGAAPVLVLAVEARRESPTRAAMFAAATAIAGLALMLGAPSGGRILVGVPFALAAAAGFAALTLLGRVPVAGLDGPATIGFGFLAGATMLAVLASATVGLGFTPTVTTIALLTFFGCVPTALAYTLFFIGLRRRIRRLGRRRRRARAGHRDGPRCRSARRTAGHRRRRWSGPAVRGRRRRRPVRVIPRAAVPSAG